MQHAEDRTFYRLDVLGTYAPFLIYLFVNGLFVLKYSAGYALFAVPAYLVSSVIAALIYKRVNFSPDFWRYAFWAAVSGFFVISVAVNYFTDGYSLNVDRWSAMEVGIRAVLENRYPYDIPDHMGRESSNLPVLILLGMPFYLLFGSVGYLQCFTFLLFIWLVYRIFGDYRLRLAGVALLLTSPAYLWEVYTKSDLLSNFIIVTVWGWMVCRICFGKKRMNTPLLATATALLLLTRLSAVIPVAVLLLRPFVKFSMTKKIIFTGTALVVAVGTVGFFFRNAPDWDYIAAHNPFAIQGSKQPVLLSVSYVALAALLSFRVRGLADFTRWSGTVLFVAVLVPFLMYLMEYGYHNVIDESYFDISFFNMSVPFVITAMLFKLKNDGWLQH